MQRRTTAGTLNVRQVRWRSPGGARKGWVQQDASESVVGQLCRSVWRGAVNLHTCLLRAIDLLAVQIVSFCQNQSCPSQLYDRCNHTANTCAQCARCAAQTRVAPELCTAGAAHCPFDLHVCMHVLHPAHLPLFCPPRLKLACRPAQMKQTHFVPLAATARYNAALPLRMHAKSRGNVV